MLNPSSKGQKQCLHDKNIFFLEHGTKRVLAILAQTSKQHHMSSPRNTIPRASWPNENTSMLKDIQKTRRKYYEYLNEIHIDTTKQIVLEIGADSRWCWSSTIDQNNHVLVRTTWSLHRDEPDIWQISLQELLSLLDTPQNGQMASQITTLITENTLDCLPLDVIEQLFAFVQKYNIQVISLKYRPLSIPSFHESQPYIESGAFGSHCRGVLLCC